MKFVALAWIRKDDWPRWRTIDPFFATITYDKWLSRAEERVESLEAKLRAGGLTEKVAVEKVTITPDELIEWLGDDGRTLEGSVSPDDPPDLSLRQAINLQKARAQIAAEILLRRNRAH